MIFGIFALFMLLLGHPAVAIVFLILHLLLEAGNG